MATLPPSLLWLADAPLFIDEEQIERFYDAVVRPAYREGPSTAQTTDASKTTVGGKATGEVKGTIGSAGFLSYFFRADVEAKGGTEASGSHEWNKGIGTATQWTPISTPQRQLELLALTYLEQVSNRLVLPQPKENALLLDPKLTRESPRAIVLLELLGQADADASGLPRCMLIPTAAEFSNGRIVKLFESLKFDRCDPPDYPEKAASPDELRAERKKYWAWFQEHYSSTKSMVVVEEAATANGGRINWIDYRLPLTLEGDTLHLHICPQARYATGTFAYNFIKRGYKHGLRLVGTLKSEPDLNVLAVYEK